MSQKKTANPKKKMLDQRLARGRTTTQGRERSGQPKGGGRPQARQREKKAS